MTLDYVSTNLSSSLPPTGSVAKIRKTGRRDSGKPRESYDGRERKEILRQVQDKINSMESSLRVQGGRYVSSVSRRYMADSSGNRYVVGAEISLAPPGDVMQALGMVIGDASASDAYGSYGTGYEEKAYDLLDEEGSADKSLDIDADVHASNSSFLTEMARRDARRAYMTPIAIYRGTALSLVA